MTDLSVIILTANEELHIRRCLTEVSKLTSNILVVDSFSTDSTVEIAQELGAVVKQREFLNYADQFAWAMDANPFESKWVMRLDADEIITDELRLLLNVELHENQLADGFVVPRYVEFQGVQIRFGGLPYMVLRIWRQGKATIEQRWMDEHMELSRGNAKVLKAPIIDKSEKNLTWWIQKHNSYASREAVDLLNLKHGFLSRDEILLSYEAGLKRGLKEIVYSRLPLGFRVYLYFFFRYILQLGFLDGPRGFRFHFLQGFWYRYLVDAKIEEVERYMSTHEKTCIEAIREVLDIEPVFR